MPAQADPDLAMRLAKAVSDLYGDAAARMLRLVAERLARGITEPGWAEAKLLEMVALRTDARRIVAALEAEVPQAVVDALNDAYRTGSSEARRELGVDAVRTNTRSVTALIDETVSMVTSTHGQILRLADDVYRAVIAETTVPGVVAGVDTRRQAAQRALDRFADGGVRGFTDRAGRRWELESYVEMATRTGSTRAQVAGHLDRYTDDGRDLVIVSDAPQECKACRPWEGRVLSITGATPGYPTVADARAAGLHHPNCRHALGAYIPGLTQRMTHTADPEGDRLRQQQRYLERQVRKWKRRQAVAMEPDAERVARAKVREWQAALKAHVDDNGLKRLRYREQITKAR